jgi:PAS domain S-box-containing protein
MNLSTIPGGFDPVDDPLKKMSEPLYNLADHIPGCSLYRKVQNLDGTMFYSFYSQGVKTILGLEPSDILQDSSILRNQIFKEDLSSVIEAEKVAKDNLTDFDLMFRVHHKNGDIKWIHTRSRPFKTETGQIVWDGISMDVTANKEAEIKVMENALQKSEDHLRTVFENTEVGYILFNQHQEIVSFNKPASIFAIKEFKKEIHIGTNFNTYFPDIMRDYLSQILAPVLNGETSSFERFIIHEEEHHWYHVKFSPVFNKEQEVAGFIMSMDNITERKKNDIALNKSLELVTEQNKRLLNFSYIVSHNLRSHASNMISILNFLEKEKSEQEKAGLLIHLKKVSHLLNETLFNLNEVVSIQKNLNTTLEKLNLFDYINQTISILNKEIKAKNAIVENQVPTDMTINYNPAYLESILLNFLSNAVKYSSPERQPMITISCIAKQKSVVLTISDNGIGIDLIKYHDKLFGMYKTFHGNKDARGIGLFITKNQIDAMGGKVEVESKINVGTSFKITFI